MQVLTLPGAGISSAAAALAAAGEPRQLGAGRSQRGAHHYTVVLLLPSLARPTILLLASQRQGIAPLSEFLLPGEACACRRGDLADSLDV